MIQCDKCKKLVPYVSRTVAIGKTNRVWACQKCIKKHYPKMYKEDKVVEEIAEIINSIDK